jgi:hypothetical protein
MQTATDPAQISQTLHVRGPAFVVCDKQTEFTCVILQPAFFVNDKINHAYLHISLLNITSRRICEKH